MAYAAGSASVEVVFGSSGGAPGGCDDAPGGQPSPRRWSLFGADAAPLPEMPEVVTPGSGDMPVRAAKCVPLTRLHLRTERVTEANVRAAAPDVR